MCQLNFSSGALQLCSSSLLGLASKPTFVWVHAEVHRSSSQASGLSSGLPSTRSKLAKEMKDRERNREGGEQDIDLMFDRNRVPLQALVRKSAPIAVAAVPKAEPAEPQVSLICLLQPSMPELITLCSSTSAALSM